MKAFKIQIKKHQKRKHSQVDFESVKSLASPENQKNHGPSQWNHDSEENQEPKSSIETETEDNLFRENVPENSLDVFLNTLPDSGQGQMIETITADGLDEDNSYQPRVVEHDNQPLNNLSRIDKIVADYSSHPFKKVLFMSDEGETNTETHLGPIKNWSDAGLPLPLMNVIKSKKYFAPTPVQAQTLPVIMSGHDVVGIAPTGSGKTAAFAIPMCRHIAANQDNYSKIGGDGPYALVLTPTRELCKQICSEVEPWSSSLQLKTLACYGGSNIGHQISQIVSGGCNIIVATPGRLIDLLLANGGRVLSLKATTFLVIDETDRMFDMGFGPQVRKIVETIRPDRQTVVFSATMSAAMDTLVNRILSDPIKISVGAQSEVPSQVKQVAAVVSSDGKFELLKHFLKLYGIIGEETAGSVIIFTNTQGLANSLNARLTSQGIYSRVIHGGLDQMDREDAIAQLRIGKLKLLVATSVAARGIDIKLIKWVINYDAASHIEDYIHRAGRTGRAGHPGTCISFVEPEQTREAFQLSQCFDIDSMEREFEDYREKLKAMAADYSSKAPKSQKLLGFGGHGLARLESKWQLRRSAEQTIYEGEQNGQGKDAIEDEPESIPLSKQGRSFTARLVIDDAPKEARVAVTAVAVQTTIIEKYHVSLTQRGVYKEFVAPNATDESRLHLQIQSESKEDVENAYMDLKRILRKTSAEAKPTGKYSTF